MDRNNCYCSGFNYRNSGNKYYIFDKSEVEAFFETGKDRFVTTQGYSTAEQESIIIDTETKVMYLWCERDYKAGLTVMVDSEGKPLLYKGGE